MSKKPDNILTLALRDARAVFGYVALFSFFINLLLLAVPIYSLQVLDRVISSGSMETLMMLSIVMVAIFAASSVVQAIRGFVLGRLGEWMDERTGPALLQLTIANAARRGGVGGGQNMRDMNVLKGFLVGNGLITLLDAPWSIIFIAVIFIIHPIIGWITLAGCLFLMFMAWLNEIALRNAVESASEQSVKSMQQVDIAIRNAEVVEAMGMMPAVTHFWKQGNQKVQVLQSLASNRTNVIQSGTKFIRLMLQMLVTGVGAYLCLKNEMTAGGIIAASILTGRALAPFEGAIMTWKGIAETRKSYSRLMQSLEYANDRGDSISLPKPIGNLFIDKLVYIPGPQQRPILKGLTFGVHAGEMVGIIGPSAAGKSTLAKLMVGVWKPTSGVVRLDNADVFTWKRDEFGLYVGYLPQDVELFGGTVRDNIARLRPDATDADVVRAAQMAGVHELILHLPNGYETDIGTGGSSLSAGQRQRIGLARAFYGDPKLVVLDEPNANLDQEGEQALARALLNAKHAGITCIVVSHRTSILSVIDKLLVMKDGAIEMYGPVKEVIEKMNAANAQAQARKAQELETKAQKVVTGTTQPPGSPPPAA